MIKGFNGTSLIDYPDIISSVVFIGGCNFRCPICHNPELVLPELLSGLRNLDEKEVLMEIKKRKGFIDGVVITGGEPLLYENTIELIRKIKDIGLKVKIDTNGSFPENLKKILPFVDYIAMDIKSSIKKYNAACGVKVNIDKILESIEIVKGFKEHEFRTTVHPKYVLKEDIIEILNLIKGAKRYKLQNTRGLKNISKEVTDNLYTDKEFQDLIEIVKNYFSQKNF